MDEKIKPWLIEINSAPSFYTDTPLDKKIKQNVLVETFKLLDVTAKNKLKTEKKLRMELQKRILTGKKEKMTIEKRNEYREIEKIERDTFYNNFNYKNFEKIYPLEKVLINFNLKI